VSWPSSLLSSFLLLLPSSCSGPGAVQSKGVWDQSLRHPLLPGRWKSLGALGALGALAHLWVWWLCYLSQQVKHFPIACAHTHTAHVTFILPTHTLIYMHFLYAYISCKIHIKHLFFVPSFSPVSVEDLFTRLLFLPLLFHLHDTFFHPWHALLLSSLAVLRLC
jgi:hypothetical protein